MKLRFIVLNFLFCLAATSAYADNPCDSYTSEYDKSYCLSKFLSASDKALNESYQSLRTCLNDEQKFLLKQAQLKWLKSRESSCAARSQSTAMIQCTYDLNISRTQLLQDLDRQCEAGYISNEKISQQSNKTPDFIVKFGPKIALKSDNGKYLSVCNNCIYSSSAHYPNSATIHIDTVNNFFTQWTIAATDEGNNFLLKAGEGEKLLARNKADDRGVVMVYKTETSDPNAQWQIITLSNGRLAISDGTGHYLCRCSDCYKAAYPDVADTHCTSSDDPAAQWAATPIVKVD